MKKIPVFDQIFHSADFGQIEVRVLFWLAGHVDGLKAFRDNRPIYEEMAAAIFGKPAQSIKDGSIERQLGKSATLGCGFAMGHKKFRQDVKDKVGLAISEALAKQAVSAYRSLHYPVPIFWKAMERAAIRAVRGESVKVGLVTWEMECDFLTVILPSGRRLYYYEAKVEMEPSKFNDDEMVPVLYHGGVNQKTRKWGPEKTYGGKLVENVVQATARDLMRDAMFRVRDAGYTLRLTVHDELLATSEGKSQSEFEKLMAMNPPWARGVPIKVSGWEGPRYKK